MMITQFPQQKSNYFPIILIGLFLASIFLATITIPPRVLARHAVEKHGVTDVSQIRTCLDENGPYQIWKSKIDPKKFFLLCQLDDGRWGMQIVTNQIRQCFENTCFVPKDGSWVRVIEYLRGIATRFNGSL